MATEPQLELHVAYCSPPQTEASLDPDFQVKVQWDVPLLDGYSWSEVPNKGSGKETFWGLNNPGLKTLICEGRFDAVICYVGYLRASFWIAWRAAKASGAAFLFGTDAHTLSPRVGTSWKARIKKLLWPVLFRLADQVIVPSSGTFALMRSLGIPEQRISLTPYAVDNDWWKANSAKVDRDAVRSTWGAAPSQPVILFCAKMQPWKRPMDLLRAFASANIPQSLLVFAGDGPLRSELEGEVTKLGLQQRVRFIGFINQSGLPAVYTAADLLVLPSSYDAFAVVVNESMCCGCPVIVSDQVGAALDLVVPVRPEFVFRVGDIRGLAEVLRTAFSDRQQLSETGRLGFDYVETHSAERNVAATVNAVRRAVKVVRGES